MLVVSITREPVNHCAPNEYLDHCSKLTDITNEKEFSGVPTNAKYKVHVQIYVYF